jgi:hypothetical protein
LPGAWKGRGWGGRAGGRGGGHLHPLPVSGPVAVQREHARVLRAVAHVDLHTHSRAGQLRPRLALWHGVRPHESRAACACRALHVFDSRAPEMRGSVAFRKRVSETRTRCVSLSTLASTRSTHGPASYSDPGRIPSAPACDRAAASCTHPRAPRARAPALGARASRAAASRVQPRLARARGRTEARALLGVSLLDRRCEPRDRRLPETSPPSPAECDSADVRPVCMGERDARPICTGGGGGGGSCAREASWVTISPSLRTFSQGIAV